MPFGRESWGDQPVFTDRSCYEIPVTNAFRQGVLGGQSLTFAGLTIINVGSPMPFGRESWGDMTDQQINQAIADAWSPMPFGRESWGDF